jgi:hypothetical protein
VSVRKGYCEGCPFDVGKKATEEAYNLGCLPSIGEIYSMLGGSKAWACHSEPDKVCCGDAKNMHKPLLHVEGIHV